MRKLLSIVSMIALVSIASFAAAQSFSAGTFVKQKEAYAVATTKLHTQYARGKLTIGTEALLGANVTNPSGAFGCAEIANYDAGRGWSVFAGPGISRPISDLGFGIVKTLTWNDFGVAIGIRGPIDLSSLFGSTSKPVIADNGYHVISGPGQLH